MKANDRQAKKALPPAELQVELRHTQDKLFQLRFKHRVAAVANPAEIRSLRRHAARLKTWLGQKAAPAVQEA